jgi:hypothetical protein
MRKILVSLAAFLGLTIGAAASACDSVHQDQTSTSTPTTTEAPAK